MRPNSRTVGSVLLAALSVGWIAFKSEYLRMPLDAGIGILLVAPGFVLLVASTFVAFSDLRRRLGGTLLALGLVAGLWLTLDPRTHTVVHEYSGLVQVYGRGSLFASPDPIRLGLTGVGISLGTGLLLGRSGKRSR